MVWQNDCSRIMKRRLLYGVVITVLSFNVLIGARVYLSSAQAAEKDSVYPSLQLFSYVMEKVRKDYVDGQSLKYQDLVYAALKGMLNTLDPHSEFMEPEKYKELQSDTQGAFGGVGIVVSMKDNFITVIAPMEDSPGFKAGIMSGDRIMKIDGTSTEKMSLPDAVKSLRGEPDTDVKITVLRPSSGQMKDYKLTRAVINVDMVKDINGKKEFPLGDNKIGYIRLVQFGEKTSDELQTALAKLTAEHMQGLVLDLRWNPGGLLDQAVDVCEKFLPRGDLVVTTEGRNPSQNSVRKAKGRGDELHDMPMVVLVNLGSASASSHKVIHEVGITPNIVVSLTEEQERDIQMRQMPGGVLGLDDKDRERVLSTRDPQLDRAMDLLKGIALFTQRAPVVEPRLAKGEKMAAK